MGCARMFGYAVPDATRYLLLSRDPAEFWQRSATYNYAFLSQNVYFPLARRFRGPVLASFLTFAVYNLFFF